MLKYGQGILFTIFPFTQTVLIVLFSTLDNEPPEIYGCPDDVIIPVISSSNQVLHSWTPPLTSDNSDDMVDVVFTCLATTPQECNQAGYGTFSVGVTMVMYKARDMSGNENKCDFTVTVTGLCERVCFL